MLRHLQHVVVEFAGLRLVFISPLVEVRAEGLNLFVGDLKLLRLGYTVVRMAVARSVVEEIMIHIERVGYIYFRAVVHHDVRQNTSSRVAFQFMSFLPLAVVDGLDTTTGGQVVLAGRHFNVSAIGDRTYVLDQTFAVRALTD